MLDQLYKTAYDELLFRGMILWIYLGQKEKKEEMKRTKRKHMVRNWGRENIKMWEQTTIYSLWSGW